MLSSVDKAQISAFLSTVVRGEAKLGLGAMPMLKLYAAAQHDAANIPELIMADNDAVRALLAALSKRSKDLPMSIVKQLEGIVTVANAGG
jgi:hypothetical protein